MAPFGCAAGMATVVVNVTRWRLQSTQFTSWNVQIVQVKQLKGGSQCPQQSSFFTFSMGGFIDCQSAVKSAAGAEHMDGGPIRGGWPSPWQHVASALPHFPKMKPKHAISKKNHRQKSSAGKFLRASSEHPWSILRASSEHPWSILGASLKVKRNWDESLTRSAIDSGKYANDICPIDRRIDANSPVDYQLSIIIHHFPIHRFRRSQSSVNPIMKINTPQFSRIPLRCIPQHPAASRSIRATNQHKFLKIQTSNKMQRARNYFI